jgi:hypothetical protein
MDYRWLPETTSDFGLEIATTYLHSANALAQAATELEESFTDCGSNRLNNLIDTEVKRARFEAAELKVMHHQQLAMNSIAHNLNSEEVGHNTTACDQLQKAIDALVVADEKAHVFNLPDGVWYFNNINKWLTNEFKNKIKNCSE